MYKISILLLIGVMLLIPKTLLALDESMIYRSILKIRTYTYNSTSQTYTLTHLGSAVAIGSGRLLTNAHVIFDVSGEKPNGYYEVCRTIDFRLDPVCFATAELLAYDESVDLALLSYNEPSDIVGVPLFGESQIRIGAPVVIYGYPNIGGENISRSAGNIAGYQDPYYKIDGAIDHGNSGGGAFNIYGELLGIPTRVASDNAVFGYMIPITTIRDFLRKKTLQYTRLQMPTSPEFRSFIKMSQSGERSRDIINDANIKTVSLKKYGLKSTGKIQASQAFLYGFSANNLKESTFSYGCIKIGGALTFAELDQRESSKEGKKYTKTIKNIGKGDRYTLITYTSLLETASSDVVQIFDNQNTCAAFLYNVNLKKNQAIIKNIIDFVIQGITLKKNFPLLSGFQTDTFLIRELPKGLSLVESPVSQGQSSYYIGYYDAKNTTGSEMSTIDLRKRATINNYFLGGNGYDDIAPSNPDLKSTDYSPSTYLKLFQDEYGVQSIFAWHDTKNHKKILIGVKTGESSRTIIVSYPYMIETKGKPEYYTLQYTQEFDISDTLAFDAVKSFFLTFEPIGTTPF